MNNDYLSTVVEAIGSPFFSHTCPNWLFIKIVAWGKAHCWPGILVEKPATQSVLFDVHMVVSINGCTQQWLVCNGKSHLNGWFGGTPISGNHHMMCSILFNLIKRIKWSTPALMRSISPWKIADATSRDTVSTNTDSVKEKRLVAELSETRKCFVSMAELNRELNKGSGYYPQHIRNGRWLRMMCL